MRTGAARLLLALLPCALAWAAQPAAPCEIVEFPYAQFPRHLWERELAWLKNIGIRGVSLPAGDAAARAEVQSLLSRLNLSAVPEDGLPRVSAMAPNSVVVSREEILKGRHAVIWTDVETTLTPALHPGAVSLAGDDLGSVNALRRDARLAQYWSPLLETSQGTAMHGASRPLPEWVTARQLTGHGASAVIVSNHGAQPWTGTLRAAVPKSRQFLVLPAITVAPGESLWIPLSVPLASRLFCNQCTAFGNDDRLVYATSELNAMEFENGTLALEFYAPVAGEAVLETARQPRGPYLAGGRLKSFEWDSASHRVKLAIPAGKAPLFRTRVALAIDAPDQSAFFVDAKRLVIGEGNRVLTSYSSPELARRSRLKLPAGWTATAQVKSPLEIEYAMNVPAGLVHGDHAEFALEADGVEMSRARVTLVRPVSLRVHEGVSLHLEHGQELPVWPALVPVEQPAGRTITVVIHNGAPEIRTFRLAIDAAPLEFSPATQEVVVGAGAEREVTFRVFAASAAPNAVTGRMRLSGAAKLEEPVQFVVIPRGQTVAYQAQMDGVGAPEYVLESSHARAVFENEQGGRWLDFVWKESNRGLLADGNTALGPARIQLRDAQLSIDPAPAGVKLEPFSDVRVESAAGVFTVQRVSQ